MEENIDTRITKLIWFGLAIDSCDKKGTQFSAHSYFYHAPTNSLEVGDKCVLALGPSPNKIWVPTYTPIS